MYQKWLKNKAINEPLDGAGFLTPGTKDLLLRSQTQMSDGK